MVEPPAEAAGGAVVSFRLEVEIVARRGEFRLDAAFESESTLTALFGP